MVLMAFLAVLREGVETVVFLLAAFNQSTSGASAPAGAALGIVVAVGLGYGIYRGGVRINLSKFFRATGLVLVLVAAGLVVNALRTAHEAGWLDVGQGGTVDLSWLVDPGSVQASLLTGMLGLQSRPVVIEVVGWLLYLVPVGVFVAWPPGRSVARRTVGRGLLATGVGLEQALTASAATCPPPLRTEVTALVARLTARWPTEQALRSFADDLNDAAGDFVVASLLLANRRRGPGLSRVLTAVAGSVGDEVASRRKVEAERAKPRSTARLVTLITLGVAGVLMLNGTYLAPYGDGLGQLVLAVIAAAFTGCLLWIRALTLAPPAPRFLTGAEVGGGR